MSSLESLPTELLIDIFLLSLNLELPRSSPIIAGKLSSERTILDTIIGVFEPTWTYLIDRPCHISHDITDANDIPGDPLLQVGHSGEGQNFCNDMLLVCHASLPLHNGVTSEESRKPMAAARRFSNN